MVSAGHAGYLLIPSGAEGRRGSPAMPPVPMAMSEQLIGGLVPTTTSINSEHILAKVWVRTNPVSSIQCCHTVVKRHFRR